MFEVAAAHDGVTLLDLSSGNVLPHENNRQISTLSEPSVWIEPRDPEILFHNVAPPDPTLFMAEDKARVLPKNIKAGASFKVRANDGALYELRVLDFVPGDRASASMKVALGPVQDSLSP